MRKVGSASDLRAEARKLLVNNWGHSAVMALLMAVMSVLIGAISDSILVRNERKPRAFKHEI